MTKGFPNYGVVDVDQFSVFIGEDPRLREKLRKQFGGTNLNDES
jgi:hypothetical protein